MSSNMDSNKSTAIRELIATVDGEVASLLSQEANKTLLDGVTRLQVAWVNIVALLDLGPEPEVFPCPSCKQIVRSEATRCGYCWVSLKKIEE